ncbi:MAG: hypothetical protein JW987_14880, partial [Anaerolineaceae bacterium]|nr:hypothetical protein [Anaerolineaceae bacterium]
MKFVENLYTPHLPAELVAQLKKHPITGVDQEIAVLRLILNNALAHLPANPTFNQRLRLLHAAARAASVIARLTVTAQASFDPAAKWAELSDRATQVRLEMEQASA